MFQCYLFSYQRSLPFIQEVMKLLRKQGEWILWTGFATAMVLLIGTLYMFDLIPAK